MWEQHIQKELEDLAHIDQKRSLQMVEHADRHWLSMNGRRMLNLVSNNYLGLAGHRRLKEAALKAITDYGVGATASRLVIGNHPLYEQAERALQDWKQAEACLIVHNGYTANTGILSALLGRNDVIFSDKLNHASIVDGTVLSRAEWKRYRHNDANHLETLLKKTAPHKRKLIVTESVFSMDGDVAPLHDLVTLKKRYNALLMVDEAHGSGVYGPAGVGVVHALNLQDEVDIQMGTFSKALGSFGAYVIGRRDLIDYLVNKMRSFIFSTALPPAVLGSIMEAIQCVQEMSAERQALLKLASTFRNELGALGFHVCNSHSQSHIVPVMIGPNDRTVKFSSLLKDEVVASVAIRPPTVPDNEARIRFALTAAHNADDLRFALDKIAAVGKQCGVIG
jgi:8-amino-7-oxononanoate synthase